MEVAAVEVLSNVPTPPGIDSQGLPTIDVCGNEVPIAA